MDLERPLSLAMMPPELLEHIAFFAATDNSFLGPPHGLIPLLTLNRRIHSALSFEFNPHLYSRIFTFKFDVKSAIRRLGVDHTHARALAEELRRRSIHLKRLRGRSDSRDNPSISRHDKEDRLDEVLWTAYFMMLESDGKNERQLREYAQIDDWLKDFWFHSDGASRAMWSVKGEEWPANHERMSLAMWLLWLTLKPEEYMADQEMFRSATGILKLIALGAHTYPLCYPSWCDFIPNRPCKQVSRIRHYSTDLNVAAPAPAAPAILAYLTLANKLTVSWEAINYMKPLAPTVASLVPVRSSTEWEGEWVRTLSVADPKVVMGNTLSGAFRPGSLQGVWEGLFTYTEFTAYAALLSGAPPATLQRSLVAQHRQTWKLREYYLFDDGSSPLPPGNPSRGYIPDGAAVREVSDGLEMKEVGSQEAIVYHSWSTLQKNGVSLTDKVKDVFITGEGHSAWGQFNLIGRVRPGDGFFSLSKEYVDGERGRWLYRGYMIGDVHANLSGRWRDTLTPPQVAGYEGCFVLSRRR
ncbi:hypothetical protein QCA50_008207 [Cerrena zonata]|uniref:Uncharacterized protein n=1 Tax=Cerrena zonata TaxID=2478898 RepID=A0AAW0GBI3_9APHY